MIDIHAHILPHLDDGAVDWEDSLAMARLAVKSGVTAMAATPHCGITGHRVLGRAEEMRERLALFREKLEQENIPLKVFEGMELFGTEDTARLLDQGLLTTLNDSRYPLIEFPFEHYGRQATRILDDVLSLGYRPVVAHPERYRYVQSDPGILNVWVDMGCLLQVNRGSFLGRFGPAAEELSWAMAGRGFLCIVASDAHSSVERTTWMRDISELLVEEFSEQAAKLYLNDYPARIIENRPVDIPEPNWF